ncbi:MAG: hypothetical protein ACOYL9_15425 [Ilumatobacteraceae bacterium]
MSSIDHRGRDAASTLQRAMNDGFDVETGLAQVRDEQVVVRIATPVSPRRLWMVAAAAATIAVLVSAGALVLRDNERVDVSDSTNPTTVITTSPSTTVSTTSSSVPTTALPGQDVIVADVVETVEPRRKVVATLGYGDGPRELGIENCQECEPARPWAPVPLPDGRVLIADTPNVRWVAIESTPSDTAGDQPTIQTTETPWPLGVVAIAQPAVDDAGNVYVTMFGPFGTGGTQSAELWVFDPADLSTPVSRHPLPLFRDPRIQFTPASVLVGGITVDGLKPVIAHLTTAEYLPVDPATGRDAPSFRVEWSLSAGTSTFEYGAGNFPSLVGPLQGPNGSVFISVTLDGREFIDRLTPAGEVLRTELPPGASVFGSGWADQNGFYRLEGTDDPTQLALVHYDLP